MKQRTEKLFEQLLQRRADLEPQSDNIRQMLNMMIETYNKGGKILVCGNGGSNSDAEHIVAELMKGFMLKRKLPEDLKAKMADLFGYDGEFLADNLQGSLPAINLNAHCSLMSAYGNDVASVYAYAQQVYGFSKPEDMLLCLSTSGMARNVRYAAKFAKIIGLPVASLTGESGGKLKYVSNCTVHAPSSETHIIQEYHLSIYHFLCAAVESEFFDE